jgi:hypothetical protein
MPSLSDKLKSLGVKIGAQDLPPPPQVVKRDLETVLHGQLCLTSQGETYVVDTYFPLNHKHGKTFISPVVPSQAILTWADYPAIGDIRPDEFVFLDTETTGLSGGTGTYAFLIGVGRLEDDQFHLAQYFMRDPFEEPAQLAALESFLAPAKALVTFNGKSFDVPLLTTRFLFQGWSSPLKGLIHFDLLHLARRLWRNRLPNRSLGNLEIQILDISRTEEDIPGWAIPQMYFDYLRTGDADPLKSIFYHNAMDVVSLAALYNHLSILLDKPLESTIKHGVDLIALARLYEGLGDVDTAVQLYVQGLEYENTSDEYSNSEYLLPKNILLEAIQRLAHIHKKMDNMQAAISLWEKAAFHNHLQSHVELAMFYEHRTRDYSEALQWTQSAINLVNTAEFSPAEKAQWLPDLENRKNRLLKKIYGH